MTARLSLRLALAALVSLAAPARAAIFTVTSTADAGAGSLRQAIEGANGNPLPDRIEFAIPGDGPHVIQPLGALQPIEDEVTIDGLTQDGASCAAWPPALPVVLDGSLAGDATDGLVLNGDDSTVQGLVIHSFDGFGLWVEDAADVAILCNFIGTDETGLLDRGNDTGGMRLAYAPNATIGGASPVLRNLISGNGDVGIVIYQNSEDSEVIGNYIGTDVTGLAALPNDNTGVYVRSADVTVGGPGSSAGNLISGNFGHGVTLGASGGLVFSNRIGVDAEDAPVLGNLGSGVLVTNNAVDSLIGAPPFEDQPLGNVIAGNTLAGVSLYLLGNTGHSIRYNEIYDNGDLGIQLEGPEDEPTPNDVGDADEGANRRQNFPELAAADWNGETTMLDVAYRVPTDPANATYPLTVDFYVADDAGEEGRFLIAIDTFSEADFTGSTEPKQVSLAVIDDVAPGDRIVATATDADGNTSEFSVSTVVPEPAAAASVLAAWAALAAATRATRRARGRASRAAARG